MFTVYGFSQLRSIQSFRFWFHVIATFNFIIEVKDDVKELLGFNLYLFEKILLTIVVFTAINMIISDQIER